MAHEDISYLDDEEINDQCFCDVCDKNNYHEDFPKSSTFLTDACTSEGPSGENISKRKGLQ